MKLTHTIFDLELGQKKTSRHLTIVPPLFFLDLRELLT